MNATVCRGETGSRLVHHADLRELAWVRGRGTEFAPQKETDP